MNFILIITIISCIIIFNFNNIHATNERYEIQNLTSKQLEYLIKSQVNKTINDLLIKEPFIQDFMFDVIIYGDINYNISDVIIPNYLGIPKYPEFPHDSYNAYGYIQPEYNFNKSDYIKYNDNWLFILTGNNLSYFDLDKPKIKMEFILPQNNYNMHLSNNNVFLTSNHNDTHTIIHVFDTRYIKTKNIITQINEFFIPGHISESLLIDNKLYLVTHSKIDEIYKEQTNVYYFNDNKTKSTFTNIFVIDKNGIINNRSFLLDHNMIYLTDKSTYIIEQESIPIITYQDVFKDIFFTNVTKYLLKDTKIQIHDILINNNIDNKTKISKITNILSEYYNDLDPRNKRILLKNIGLISLNVTGKTQYNEPYTTIHRISNDNGNLTYINNIRLEGNLQTGYSAIHEHKDTLRLVLTSEYRNYGHINLKCDEYTCGIYFNDIQFEVCNKDTECYFNLSEYQYDYYYHISYIYETDVYILDKSLNKIQRIKDIRKDIDLLDTRFYNNLLYLTSHNKSYIVDFSNILHSPVITSNNNVFKCNEHQYNDTISICFDYNKIKLINTFNKTNHVIVNTNQYIDNIEYRNKNWWYSFDRDNNMIFIVNKQVEYDYNDLILDGFIIYKIIDGEFKHIGNIYHQTGDNYINSSRGFMINDIIYNISNLDNTQYVTLYDSKTLDKIISFDLQ